MILLIGVPGEVFGESGRIQAPEDFMRVSRNAQEPAPRSIGRFRVMSDAVVGGGFDLRAGEVVESSALGEHANALIVAGAVIGLGDETHALFH